MSIDVSTISLAVDSTSAVTAKGNLDALGPAAAGVATSFDNAEKSGKSLNAGMQQLASSAGATRATMSEAAAKYIDALQRELDQLGKTRGEVERLEAASMRFTKAEREKVQALGEAIDAYQREEVASKAEAAAQDRASAAQANYIAKLREKVALQNLDAVGAEKYRAAQLGMTAAASAEAAGLIAQLEKGTVAAAAHKAEVKAAGHEMEQFGFHTARSKTELIVLGHELAQGRFTRFGGSMMVLAEQTGVATLAFSSMGAVILGVGAVFAGFTAAVVAGYLEQERFNKALVLTGNFAGQTNDSMQRLSRTIADSTHASVGGARTILDGLVGTGEIGPRMIEPMARAAVELQRLSGETADKVIKDFAKLADAPTKTALEWNKAFNFLSVQQYEHIKRLEEMGDREGAALVATQALTDHFKDAHAPAIGYVAGRIEFLVKDLSNLKDWMMSIGREETFTDRLAKINGQLAALDEGRNRLGESGRKRPGILGDQPDDAARREELMHKREEMLRGQAGEARAAYYKAEDAEAQKAGIAGREHLDLLDKRTRGVDRLKKKLEDLAAWETADLKARKITDPNAIVDPADHARRVAELERENAPKKGPKGIDFQSRLDNAAESRLNSLGTEGAKLQAEIEQWAQYGKAIDNSRVATLAFDIDQGKLLGKNGAALDGAQKYALWLAAYNADLLQAALNEDKAATKVENRTKQIEAAANATAKNARETAAANEVERINQEMTERGTERYRRLVDARIKAVNDEADAKLKIKLSGQMLSTDDEVQKLDQLTNALGRGTLATKDAAIYAKLFAQAQAEIAANPAQTAQILDAMTERYLKLSAAEQRAYDASRDFQVGARTALEKYAEAATNYGSAAEKAISGGFTKMEDAIVSFTKTGKLNLGGLFQFMADEFIRQQTRMLLAQAAGGSKGGGGILGDLLSAGMSYFSGGVSLDTGGAGMGAGSGYANGGNGGLPTRGGAALGGNVNAGQTYLVGEKGPEMLRMGSQGGSIVPTDRLGGANVSVVINNNASGTKASAQETKGPSGERQIQVMIEEVVAGSIASGGAVHSAMAGTYGLNRASGSPRY